MTPQFPSPQLSPPQFPSQKPLNKPLDSQPNSQPTALQNSVFITGALLIISLLSPTNFAPLVSTVSAQTTIKPTTIKSTTSKSTTTKRKASQAISKSWLNHYLPVDRPRIAGGIWKFLSTDTDRHYHRPDSAFMLSQPSDQIIGFASAADAQEAGYLPGPSVHDSNRQNGRWFEQGNNATRSNVTIRVAPGPGSQGSPSRDSLSQGSLNFSIPASQIPRDVYVIIQATDILADAIDKAADADTAGAIYRMLRRMRHNSQDYIDLSALTGHREAFADATRWYPTLQMLEQGALAKMNRGGIAEVNQALSRQSTHRARNNARMLIPQVKAAINRSFSDKVARESQRMLGR